MSQANLRSWSSDDDLPQPIQPMETWMQVAGRAMPVLMIDMYGPQRQPFGKLTEALVMTNSKRMSVPHAVTQPIDCRTFLGGLTIAAVAGSIGSSRVSLGDSPSATAGNDGARRAICLATDGGDRVRVRRAGRIARIRRDTPAACGHGLPHQPTNGPIPADRLTGS